MLVTWAAVFWNCYRSSGRIIRYFTLFGLVSLTFHEIMPSVSLSKCTYLQKIFKKQGILIFLTDVLTPTNLSISPSIFEIHWRMLFTSNTLTVVFEKLVYLHSYASFSFLYLTMNRSVFFCSQNKNLLVLAGNINGKQYRNPNKYQCQYFTA